MQTDRGTDHVADLRYRFWSQFTEAQAFNTKRRHQVIDRRVERFFRDLCRQVRPTVVLELGAHEAEFSSWAKRQFPEAQCLALEANPYVHAEHREALARAGVDYRLLAAAPETGTVTIHIPTGVGGRELTRTSRMASLVTHTGSHGDEAVEVPAVRVDDLLTPGPDDRLVVWVDVEGASEQVLSGGREVLGGAAAVYMEVERDLRWHGQWLDVDVARYFDQLGKVPVLRDIQRPHQYNVVFVDAELAARQEISERAARVLRPPRQVDAD
jgi:FkbM family methyltransferase